MRRVLLVAHRLAAATPTGIGRYVAELTRAIARLEDRRFEYTLCAAREAARPTWVPPGIDVEQLAGPRRALHGAWATVRRPDIERLLGPVALVHALSAFAPVPSRAPFVATIHDLIPLDFPDACPRVERWGFRRAVRDAARRAARIITPSARVADDVHHRLDVARDRIRVIPEGIAASFFAPVPDAARAAIERRYQLERGRYLVAVGEINVRKNLLPIVRALASFGRDAPTLVLAGAIGHGGHAVLDEVHRLGLDGAVRAVGYVPDDDLPALIGDARALVHPSLYEGFGLTPLEAMAAGTPVVASRAGAVPEVVGDAAVLVDPLDDRAWAAAIRRVVDDDAQCDALRAAGNEHAARFRWDRTARETVAVHEECATDGR